MELGAPERSGDRVSIPVSGSLTRHDAKRLRDGVIEHYLDDGVAVISLDASQLTFLDEDGIGVLLRLRSEAIVKGKRIRLTNVGGQVREKLELINLLRYLEVSVEEGRENP